MSETTLPTTPTREEGREPIHKSQWFESLRIAAEEYLGLRLKVSDLRNMGEDDPATDNFKCMAMALEMAGANYREKAAPREILDLLDAFEARRSPADHSTPTEESTRLVERIRVLEGALEPFAKWAGVWPSPEDNLSVIAHCHVSPKYEAHLGTEDFRRAKDALSKGGKT
jgi:hypothetical protein